MTTEGKWKIFKSEAGRGWVGIWTGATFPTIKGFTRESVLRQIEGSTGHCYVCEEVTFWDDEDRCGRCGRVWGYEPSALRNPTVAPWWETEPSDDDLLAAGFFDIPNVF